MNVGEKTGCIGRISQAAINMHRVSKSIYKKPRNEGLDNQKSRQTEIFMAIKTMIPREENEEK